MIAMDFSEAARALAGELVERARGGEDFAELARAESDDPGSAASGGDLGFFGRGLMTPEFEQVAFELEQGGRSGIVQSPFGFYIIEVTGIRPEVATPFD